MSEMSEKMDQERGKQTNGYGGLRIRGWW